MPMSDSVPPYTIELPNGAAELMFSCTPEQRSKRILKSQLKKQERIDKRNSYKAEAQAATQYLQEHGYNIYYWFYPDSWYTTVDGDKIPLWDWITTIAWKCEDNAITGVFTILGQQDEYSRLEARIQLAKKLIEKTHPYSFGFTLSLEHAPTYQQIIKAIITTIISITMHRPKIFPKGYAEDLSLEGCHFCQECTQ